MVDAAGFDLESPLDFVGPLQEFVGGEGFVDFKGCVMHRWVCRVFWGFG